MNLPNLLTVLRIVLVPVFAWLFFVAERSETAIWAAMGVFIFASATDFLDGYIARRRGLITPLGQFLDPLADKLLVGAALVLLVIYREFPLWAAVVIGIREVVVSAMRSVAAKKGIAIPASASGKAKTAIQVPMVVAWLLPRVGSTAFVQDVAMYTAVFLTLLSGVIFYSRVRRSNPKAAD
ncbi:MAG TPA: CDP-diacylglycerol--glycerol-3-phosphate 3-phosphatidyltransferase [Actinomycetota bacterium]|nr:CDP-diacylglycerol--glycerol-3-phosphate 3-phosphatidyltransferase [Actinomycetota bacterium]